LLGVAGAVKSAKVLPSGFGDVSVGFIDTRDVGAVIAAVVAASPSERADLVGRAVNLSGPDQLTPAQTAASISTALDTKITAVEASDDDMRRGLAAAYGEGDVADAIVLATKLVREGAISGEVSTDPALLGMATFPRLRSLGDFALAHASAFKEADAAFMEGGASTAAAEGSS